MRERHTQRTHLHMDSRSRLLYIAPRSPVPGNVVTELVWRTTHALRGTPVPAAGGSAARRRGHSTARAERACGTASTGARLRKLRLGRTRRWGARALRGAGGAGRALARASADTRHSLRRNDEAAGYARALCVAASRIFPTACEVSRRGVNKPATLLLLTQWWG